MALPQPVERALPPALEEAPEAPLESSSPSAGRAGWRAVLEGSRGLLRIAEATAPRVARRSSAIVGLDELLGGGLPVGRILEVWGAPSSGSTALVLALAAGVTARGGAVAWVDAFDALDPATVAAAGVDLRRLLWVRVPLEGAARRLVPGGCDAGDAPERATTTSGARHRRMVLRALDLVLSTRGFSLVVLDVLAGPGQKRLFVPDPTWVRVARACEVHRSTLVVLGERSVAGSQTALGLAVGQAARPGTRGGEPAGEIPVRVARSRGPLVRSEGSLRVLASPIEPWALRNGRGREARTTSPGHRATARAPHPGPHPGSHIHRKRGRR